MSETRRCGLEGEQLRALREEVASLRVQLAARDEEIRWLKATRQRKRDAQEKSLWQALRDVLFGR